MKLYLSKFKLRAGILWLLLFGCCATIITSWVFGTKEFGPHSFSGDRLIEYEEVEYDVWIDDQFGRFCITILNPVNHSTLGSQFIGDPVELDNRLVDFSLSDEQRSYLSKPGRRWDEEFQGWPMYAFHFHCKEDNIYNPTGTSTDYGRFNVGIFFWNEDGAGIATIPVWSGLAFDTLFFAVIIGVIYSLMRWLVRRLRRPKHCVCEVCGYDLRGSGIEAGCPECGWNRPEGEGKSEDNE